MASGDHCRINVGIDGNADGTITHFDCDDYGDGAITDLRGRVLRYRPKHWVVEEAATS